MPIISLKHLFSSTNVWWTCYIVKKHDFDTGKTVYIATTEWGHDWEGEGGNSPSKGKDEWAFYRLAEAESHLWSAVKKRTAHGFTETIRLEYHSESNTVITPNAHLTKFPASVILQGRGYFLITADSEGFNMLTDPGPPKPNAPPKPDSPPKLKSIPRPRKPRGRRSSRKKLLPNFDNWQDRLDPK